jgi:multidrug efflux pump subunit AcrB
MTLNVMSSGHHHDGGIVVSNSIDRGICHRLEKTAAIRSSSHYFSCLIRLRPILMIPLLTVIGLIPMALKLGTGSEQYAPLARAIIGGLMVSVFLTVFLVPAAYLLLYGRRDESTQEVAA